MFTLTTGAVTACDNPGSAVIVSGTSITQDALATRCQTVISEAGVDSAQVDLAALNRRILTGWIRHRLIEAAAAKAGVTVSAADVSGYLDAQGRGTVATALRVPLADVGDATRDVLELSVILKLSTSDPQVPNVDVAANCVKAATSTDVNRLRRQLLTDPARAGAAPTTFDLIGMVGAAPDGLYTAGAGQVVTINVSTAAGVQVCLVTDRQRKQGALTVAAINQYTSFQDRINLASLILSGAAATTAIDLNPRYGTWDPVTVQVVPGPNES